MSKRRASPQDRTATEQVLFVRLPRELIARLDAHVAQERERTGYPSLTRKDVVGRILDQALSETEGRK